MQFDPVRLVAFWACVLFLVLFWAWFVGATIDAVAMLVRAAEMAPFHAEAML
jgi:hypothetical protein